MVRRHYGLPSLAALAAFEASARHASLTLASQELNVTPGALSRQIKTIEQEVGVPLFVRTGRGIKLTEAGHLLFATLSKSFYSISEAIEAIKHDDTSRGVAIACSDVFATMWLIPRMPDFWDRHPDISVDHVIWENTRNIRRGDVELRIRYGLGSWAAESSELLFDDCVYPVCSPRFAAEHASATIADLPDLPLLSVDSLGPDWMNWEEALLRGGNPGGAIRLRRIGNFGVALQAAMAHQGLVLGWHRLVAPLVAEGTLRRLTALVVPAPGGYYLTRSAERKLSPAAVTLREWILEKAEAARAAPCPRGDLPGTTARAPDPAAGEKAGNGAPEAPLPRGPGRGSRPFR
ncbi:LysR substrate-binding domain-containing protein [Amaricoccus solimangrovi]|uniref:LysR family transcriptional regulator n=1 Tax=Amaricoccus solimangrovi TaxID=2589815 RepID=A0A501W7V1_9RHOB|nr:LysR substrate-binding domain-containing protein [Amaricoccus solimangrovi]TPE45669.1 LysR family transcriptional regulator [Amaricoccus solimangrovi]